MCIRDRIIATATEAFTTKGIKSITMDDIAAALGISKRTLYEVFVDKESLLKDCLLYTSDMAKKTVAAKKRNVKVDANGQLHVHSSFNNIIVSLANS